MSPVEIQTRGDAVVAVMPAEIDLANAQQIGDMVLDAIPNEASGLVVDLTAVTYLDSTGIRMLLKFARRLSACRQHLAILVSEGSRVRALLTIANLEEVAPINLALEPAIAWLEDAGHSDDQKEAPIRRSTPG